ncbi:cobalamin synthase CobS (Cobalamin-5-phosphate synthase) [[Clostridium] sordellii]|uniref:adenosylcobinamide-GDP ribazoletransferase n=1 Tax=Paraclostridium sordellii TaxID=1505 RepID=UPI0005E873B1|nr:adenosylcobinamide-GDP ribazoletransferase [Paeniclostridium sordellii]MBX9183103.1 adenosylcobinamide-GDP ribazoletransferase [Paeniclostridium sordellii]CEN92302.1 cobalamin synthase CobS (Cobalamin-5-phosphate synthase) [[Clostridium] sordellii] [Paeniclostridium sordellii]CEN93188.1 cobalamin synthase CobS (Cobalamin-5-phosphate synthase) [[Clostridium] sordellii] [Paeniclostridium sordellii]CEO16422.1 cobalamin synthase CobS (Cobalamin-5-phosphate synthase) [[Clostridium] sordellii] [Pa
MKRFIGILQFLTRIPIHIDIGFDEEFHKTMYYFPLVGFVLGILYCLVGFISSIFFDSYITSVNVLISTVILTGGLHLDGVGDTFDGIYSYRDKEKILEIMKDSRLGTNAMLSILFLMLLKLGFIYSIIESGQLYNLIFMPVFARMAIVIASYKSVTPREKGMGNVFIGKPNLNMILVSVLYTIILIFIIGGSVFNLNIMTLTKEVFFIPVMILLTRLFVRYIYTKIDGITGDILGCTSELTEVIYLVYIYLVFALK